MISITRISNIFQMNSSIYGDYDGEGRYLGEVRGLSDSRLLDAAETLVTLQTSDLGTGSNNPLFGPNIGHNNIPGVHHYA